MEDMQPGQVIMPNPQSGPSQPPVGAPKPERPEEDSGVIPIQPQSGPAVVQPPQPPVIPTAAMEISAQAEEPTSLYVPAGGEPEPAWLYNEEPTPVPSQGLSQPLDQNLSWAAAEFIAHHKGVTWYLELAGAACVLAAVVYLLTHDIFSTGVILFTLLLFGVYASRQPRMLRYGLDATGLHVGDKTYSFRDFKTFSVTEEESVASIILTPLKRFMPPLTIYVSPDSEEAVMTALSQYLPFEHHEPDAMDALLRRIHF